MMKSVLILLCCVVVSSGVFGSNNQDKNKSVAGGEIFGSEKIHEIRINFLQCSAWDSLVNHKDIRDSLNLNRYLQGNVEVNGKKLFACGVRIKGESSYDFYPGRKKSLKINFGKYIKKQKLDGLKTINLNNAFKDPTFMREKIYLDFMRSEGLPVPRSTYANVYVNDELFGLYVLVEEINKGFVKRNFGNKNGAFFKGEPNASLLYIGDNQLDYERSYKIKSKDRKDYQVLMDFIKTLDGCVKMDQNALKYLEEVFDVYECLKVFAITSLFMNVDAMNLLHRHNYYLYKSTLDHQFKWIPYDGNYAFCAFSSKFTMHEAENLSVYFMNDRYENSLMKTVFGIKKYREFYTNYIKELLNEKFTTDYLEPKIDRLSIALRKHVYQDTMKMYSNSEFEKNLMIHLGDELDPGAFIPGLKTFAKKRVQAVRRELNIKRKNRN
ncbi:CotH kinase family protein [Marinifilum sp. D714]|uniref:CotH kinase family protein n=1 Tax=Marinifilum sp. D714 TaxID=2937523 RepID=UPI0027C58903|nr:CotH kinase family protein [Marinifilum sp. D714]MDQ2179798.1 CotH kinase family protein [Marinifilum sp. D714]